MPDLAAPETIVLRNPMDSYVRDGTYAGQNFGQSITMEVKNVASAGYDRQAYVRFALKSPARFKVTSPPARPTGSDMARRISGASSGTAWE